MRVGTHFGSIVFLLPVALVFGLREWHRGRPLSQALDVPLTLICAWGLSIVSKVWVGRSRPDLFEPLIRMPLDASFPSGHTLQTAAFAFALALRPGPVRPLAVPAALAFVAFIGLSRLYLQVHWLSDVVAGALLGLGCALVLRIQINAPKEPS